MITTKVEGRVGNVNLHGLILRERAHDDLLVRVVVVWCESVGIMRIGGGRFDTWESSGN